MAQRVMFTCRIQPEMRDAIRDIAQNLRRSEGYVIEEMVWQMYHDRLPPNILPGRKLPGDEE